MFSHSIKPGESLVHFVLRSPRKSRNTAWQNQIMKMEMHTHTHTHTDQQEHASLIRRPKCLSAENGDKMLDECGGAVSTSVCLLRPPTQCAQWEADAEHLVYFSPWICEVFSSLFPSQDQSDSSVLAHNLTPAGSSSGPSVEATVVNCMQKPWVKHHHCWLLVHETHTLWPCKWPIV